MRRIFLGFREILKEMSMNSFYTHEIKQHSDAVQEPEVLTHERLDAIYNAMDEQEKRQILVMSLKQSISIHTVIERVAMKAKADAAALDDMPMFSLVQ